MEDPRAEIAKLKDGECWMWPESDYGKAEIWFKNGSYIVFEIPMYGGVPRFEFGTNQIDYVIKTVESWT